MSKIYIYTINKVQKPSYRSTNNYQTTPQTNKPMHVAKLQQHFKPSTSLANIANASEVMRLPNHT
jgi:hypothetical protein